MSRAASEPVRQTSDSKRFLLLAGFTVSTAGDWFYRLALPILVLQLTGSAVSTALTYAIEYLPYLAFSMFAGVLADRFDRRLTMVLTDICSAVIVFGLAAMVSVFDVENVYLIYVGAFALALVRPVYHPAMQGLIPEMTHRTKLSSVNAQIQSMDSILAFAGPVLGGGIIALLNPQAALWVNGASFVGSAVAVWFLRTPRSQVRRQKISLLSDLREGLRYLRRDRVTLWGSVLMAGTNVGLYLIQANLIFILTADADFSRFAVGIVFGAYGLGAVLGAVLAPTLGRRFPAGRIIVAAMILAGVATVPLILPFGLVGFVLGWGVVGVATNMIVVTWFTLRQQIVPSMLLGRVVAASRMLAYASIPVASVGGGLVLASSSLGVRPLIAISVSVQLVVALLAWYSPLRAAAPTVTEEDVVPGDIVSGEVADGAAGQHHGLPTGAKR